MSEPAKPISHLYHNPFAILKHISDKTPVSDSTQKCPLKETTINTQNTAPHTGNSVKKVDK